MMLKPIRYALPDVDPFIREPDLIAKAKRFEKDCGDEFCERIARAVNVLAEERPIDPFIPFVCEQSLCSPFVCPT